MSKQSNQRYRKEMEQEGKSTTNSVKNPSLKETTAKDQTSQNNYEDVVSKPKKK